MVAFYNEIDPFAAAWLRELIKSGHIAPGVVDERDIHDIRPDELTGFTQCHFFAGIGVWSHALRNAGWADGRPIWTGSCPCQPFSQAGKGGGFDDERHLWPAFFHLIQQCDPAIVLGEQVASKDGLAWLDLVRADVEGTGRAFAAADLCAAGVGAPHIRQRSFWVAYASDVGRRESSADSGWVGCGDSAQGRAAGSVSGCAVVGVVNAELPPLKRQREHGGAGVREQDAARLAGGCVDGGLGATGADAGMLCGLANPNNAERRANSTGGNNGNGQDAGWPESAGNIEGCGSIKRPSPTDGFWRDADWLYCRDGKWRPVEPCTFPLAHGATNRVGRLRGYGNAIVAPVAQAFIESVMEITA